MKILVGKKMSLFASLIGSYQRENPAAYAILPLFWTGPSSQESIESGRRPTCIGRSIPIVYSTFK